MGLVEHVGKAEHAHVRVHEQVHVHVNVYPALTPPAGSR